MKISEPKIKNCEVSSFNECVKNEEFNKVKIRKNSSVSLDLTDYTFDECVFENIDFLYFSCYSLICSKKKSNPFGLHFFLKYLVLYTLDVF